MSEKSEPFLSDKGMFACIDNVQGTDYNDFIGLVEEVRNIYEAELSRLRNGFTGVILNITATAIGGLADQALIGQGPFNEGHTLAVVKMLGEESARLRAENVALREAGNALHEVAADVLNRSTDKTIQKEVELDAALIAWTVAAEDKPRAQ